MNEKRKRVKGQHTVRKVTRTLSIEALELMDRAGIKDQSSYISDLILNDLKKVPPPKEILDRLRNGEFIAPGITD